MKEVIVFGSGCKPCDATGKMVEQAAARRGIDVNVTRETDYARIAMAGVVSTPEISIDGRLVHAGGLPAEQALEGWLQAS